MKLTYRGISYQSQSQAIKPSRLNSARSLSKYLISNHQDGNKIIILVRPMEFYTYRGVSYTKNPIFDSQTKLLLDIEQQ
ncbi:MAG: DUF4278 domain-containing protein [Pleurocapsa sp. MO_226.B13]|nr:DUF4278 domain-containing protein [Pleurocapsa sp. MO_226.B13]